MAVQIDLNKATRVIFKNLREGNAFTFRFSAMINGQPIDANNYDIELTMSSSSKVALKVKDEEWEKQGNIVQKSFESFPLKKGNYQYDVTWKSRSTGRVKTIIPGSFSIIERHE